MMGQVDTLHEANDYAITLVGLYSGVGWRLPVRFMLTRKRTLRPSNL
jgi:hypothetical protein